MKHKDDLSCFHATVREPTYEDCKDKIKGKCVACFTIIPATWSRYFSYGNFCSRCSARAERILKTKLVIATLEKRIEEVKVSNSTTLNNSSLLIRSKDERKNGKEDDYYVEICLSDLEEQLKENKLILKQKISDCNQYFGDELNL